MSVRYCFIDLDGVCADLIGSVLRMFDRRDLLRSWPRGEYAIYKALGCDEAWMWEKIARDPDFWLNLELYPWADGLIAYAHDLGFQPVILSAPKDPVSAMQKLKWVEHHLGQWRLPVILTWDKHLLARPGRVLIDDFDDHVNQFREGGGEAILWPQKWNSAHADERNADGIVRSTLRRLAWGAA